MSDKVIHQKGKFEVLVELIKVVIWPIIILCLLTCNDTPTAKVVAAISKKIDSADVVKAKISGTSIELSKLKNSVSTIAKINAETSTTDLPVDKIIDDKNKAANIEAAKVIDTSINTKTESWVYIGQIV